MWLYDKKLQFPVCIKKPDPRMAKLIITQYGGADGELAASLRYLSQRFSMPTGETRATLNDIGSEELAHLEMIGTMCHQLLQGADCEMLKKYGFDADYVEHGVGVYPQNAAGVPFNAAYIQSKGDPVTDLIENLAADGATAKEQPAFLKSRKPLVLLDFQHFEAFRKNGISATT